MVTKDNFEEYALLYVDNELTKVEEEALLNFVALHPDFKTELEAYKAAVLAPDSLLTFDNKEDLLKPAPKASIISLHSNKLYYAAAASIIALLFVLFLNNGKKESTTTVAQNTPAKQTIKIPIQRPAPTKKQPETTATTVVKKPIVAPKHQQQAPRVSDAPSLPSAKERIQQSAPAQLEGFANNYQGIEEASIAALDVKPITTTTSYTPTIVEETPGYFADNVAPLLALNESAVSITQLSRVVTDKISDVKATAKQLKGSDVKIKIGNKEIFITKL